jgi:hypothetical protein
VGVGESLRIDKKIFEEEESDASQAAFDQSFSHASPELPRLLLLPTYYRWDEYDDLWMIGRIGNGDLSVGRMDRWADTNSVSSWRWMHGWKCGLFDSCIYNLSKVIQWLILKNE